DRQSNRQERTFSPSRAPTLPSFVHCYVAFVSPGFLKDRPRKEARSSDSARPDRVSRPLTCGRRGASLGPQRYRERMPRQSRREAPWNAVRRHIGCLVVLVLTALLPVAAGAQSYPAKPVKMIVTFAAGGPTDVIARIVAQKASENWGHQVVVENIAGAG